MTKVDWSNPDAVREYNRVKVAESRARDPEKARKSVRDYASSRAGDPAWIRMRKSHQMKSLYGITIEQAEEYMIVQWGMCAICKTSIVFGHKNRHHKACIDHDHDTGRIRGLLCSPCNVALGCFEDEPARLRAAADYIERKT